MSVSEVKHLRLLEAQNPGWLSDNDDDEEDKKEQKQDCCAIHLDKWLAASLCVCLSVVCGMLL